MERVSLIVAECGAQWTEWAAELRPKADRTLVLSQSPGETPTEFSKRVIERLGKLGQEDVSLQGAAYVTGRCADAATLQQRSRVMHKLSSHLARGEQDAELVLDPGATPGVPVPAWIRALAMTIADLAKGSGLSVRVAAPSAG